MKLLLFLAIFCGFIQYTIGNNITLEYYENGTLTIAESNTQNGSFTHLGVHPHWCLGDIDFCSHGLTVDFWVKAAPVAEDSPEIVLFTNGGNFYFSEGVYLLQRHGDQYEFGVSQSNKVWKINFRLYADTWVKLHAVWNVSNGLKLSVDNSEWSQEQAETREFFPEEFGFSEVLIGLTDDGEMLEEDELFEIQKIMIYDEQRNTSVDTEDFVRTLSFPGCIPETEDIGDFSPVDLFGEENPIQTCRSFCGNKLNIALIQNNTMCSCATRDVLHKLDTSNGSCDGSYVWHVYSASGVDENNPYKVEVSVTKLQTRDYVKPMETVAIEIKPNHIAQASYHMDFGDGVIATTENTTLNHFWQSAGMYTIRVTSKVGILSFESQIDFEIRDVDENIAPKILDFSSSHDEASPMYGTFELYLADKTNLTECELHFNDNHQKITYNATTDIDQYFYHQMFDHSFTTYGQFLVSTNCKNNYGFDSSSVIFLSKRFEVPFSYKIMGESFSVEMAGGQSFLADIEVVRNYDAPLDVTRMSSNITIPHSLFKPFENIISLQSGGEIFYETIFYVENVPMNASIIPDIRHGAWNLTTNISVLIPAGNNMFVTCAFGLGEEVLFYIYEAAETVTLPFEVEYENLGYYPVHVKVSNDMGEFEVEDLISVEVPIVSISLYVSNITDKNNPVVLGVDLNMEAPGPDKVTFEIDHDDGNVLSYDYRSSTILFTPYKNSYIYQDWGIYTICVSANNSISRVFDCILVQVGQNITYMDLKTTTTGRVNTSQYAEFNITILTGSDITYHVDFGDDYPFVFTDRDLIATNQTESTEIIRRKRETNSIQDSSENGLTTATIVLTSTPAMMNESTTEMVVETTGQPRSLAVKACSCQVTVKHIYSTVGYYEVKVNITNAFSSANAVLCPYMIVDNSDDSGCGDTVVNLPGFETTRNDPLIHIRSQDIVIDVQANTPSCNNMGFEYTWKAVEIFDDRETPYDDLCKLEQTNNIFTIPAVSLHFGFYKFVVTAAPISYKRKANDASIYVRIVPSNPIAHFKGEEEEILFSDGEITLDFTESHDPDLTSNIRQGLEYDLICFQKEDFDRFEEMVINEFFDSNITQLIYEDLIFETETMNPIRIYQYEECFNNPEGFKDTLTISDSIITTSTTYFIATDTVFTLIVSKDGRFSTVNKIIKMSYDNFEEQLNMLTNAQFLKDTGKALDIVNKIGPGSVTSNDTDAKEQQDKLKELALTVVATVTDYAPDADTVNRVVNTCERFTTDEVTDTAREKAASAISKSGSLIVDRFSDQDNSQLEGTLGDQVKTLSNVAPSGKAEVKEQKKNLRCKRRANPDAPDEDVETATKYEALVKAGNLLSNAILRDMYDFLFHHYAEFRTAVRNRIDNEKLPQAVLKEQPEQLFLRLGLEWDPFDIQNVILDHCEAELEASIRRTKEADKEVQSGSSGAISAMSGLILNNFEKERCRRRRRKREGEHVGDEEEGLNMSVEAANLKVDVGIPPKGTQLSNIAKKKRKKAVVDPCSKHDAEAYATEGTTTSTPTAVLTAAGSTTQSGSAITSTTQRGVTSPDKTRETNFQPSTSPNTDTSGTDGQTDTGSSSGTDTGSNGGTAGGSGSQGGTGTSGTDGQTDTSSSGGTDTGTSGGADGGSGSQGGTGTSGTDGHTDTESSGDTGTTGGTDSGSGSQSGTGTSETDGQTDTGSIGDTNAGSSGGTAGGSGSQSGTVTSGPGSTGTGSGTEPEEEQDYTDEASTGMVNAVNANNPYTYGPNSDRVTSEVTSLNLVDPDTGESIVIEDSDEDLEILLKAKCAVPKYNATIRQEQGKERVNIYHSITTKSNDSSIHFLFEAREHWELTRFRVCLVYNVSTPDPPCIHEAIMPHGEETFPEIRDTNVTLWRQLRNTYFPPQNVTKYNGEYTVTVSLESSHVDFSDSATEVVYDYQLWTSGCLFWDTVTESFITNGTRVSNTSTPEVTVCLTNHLTSFGGDFAVPPNTIDFNNVWAKFKNLNENAAVFSTVIALIGIYILLLIWARYMDKKDVQKWGASPLDDNLPSDNYHYQISVQTGMRKLASTTSKISFILSGEESDTGVRRLFDGNRKTFNRGSIMNFILSVDSCLGPLNFMRVWHDNSGKGKLRSWYLDQVQITDLQTGERYFFLCDRWLAVEEDDGMVDRILPVAGLEDLAAFKQLFSSSVKKKITNDHLWFSVFSRPTRSNFTRVQRISCCMSLLFMTMITNAMWFKSEEKQNNTSAMKIGPVSFTLQQVFVSFASTMIVFPVNFILMTFFRKCRPRKNGVMHKNQQIPKRGKWKSVAASQSQTWGRVPMKSRWQRFKESITNFINFQRHRSKYDAGDIDPNETVREMRIAGVPDSVQKKKKKKKPGTLPHWCIYIAWVLCFFSITSSGFFTILYSMEWGPEKANEWLTTFLMSFFQSVIVVQPVKVLCLVAFISCILKKPDLSDEDPGEDLNNVIAAHDEEFMAKSNTAIDEIAMRRKMANSEFKPPDMAALEEARQNRLMELKMEEVVREIGIYAFFVLILFFLSYQTRDSDSFLMAENLKATLGSGFDKISTVDGYWKWLETKLLPNLYATKYANGTEIKAWWDKRCIQDMEARRVGLPRLRQLRVKEDTCVVNPALSSVIKHCRDEYGWADDDTKPYLPRWVKPPEENITALEDSKSPWVYQNSVKLKSAPYIGTITTYKGGGYVALFQRNVTWTRWLLDELKEQVWLDVYTRGVFLEFTVYNPNINLFASVILLTEFLSSGGAVARTEVKVFRLLSYVGGFGILVIIFEVIYACFSLYFFIRCIRKVKKEKMKYFQRFWNLLEFVLLVFCIAVIAMYAFKQILSAVTMNALQDPDKAEYVNFQSMAMYDELFGWMIGCVVFLATVQFLKLLQFNRKMNMLGDTIKLATKDLKVFSIAFGLYFFAFTACAHLLFGSTMLDYSSLISSAESMFAFTLGSFDFAAMADVNKILGPLFFFTFVGVVYVGLMSMFFTIIGDAFTEVKENVNQRSNDYEIVGFIWKRMKGIMGLN